METLPIMLTLQVGQLLLNDRYSSISWYGIVVSKSNQFITIMWNDGEFWRYRLNEFYD